MQAITLSDTGAHDVDAHATEQGASAGERAATRTLGAAGERKPSRSHPGYLPRIHG